MRLFGGIEAGGTKFNCALGSGPENILAEQRIPTTTPDETIGAAIEFFRGNAPHGLAGLGIASFGPVELDRAAPNWGHILATPKPHWSGANLAGRLGDALGVEPACETDVNGAALGEVLHGAGKGLRHLAYVTIGTGIGAGLIAGGRIVHGRMHPEIGHFRPRRHPDDPAPHGVCPFHCDCLEGLASGTAIAARYGAPLSALPATHPAWTVIPDYLAQLCAVLTLTAAPQRIVLGGGVMASGGLLERIAQSLRTQLANYPQGIDQALDTAYIVRPGLGDRSGITGALCLAQLGRRGENPILS